MPLRRRAAVHLTSPEPKMVLVTCPAEPGAALDIVSASLKDEEFAMETQVWSRTHFTLRMNVFLFI